LWRQVFHLAERGPGKLETCRHKLEGPSYAEEFSVAIEITVPRLGWSMEEGTFMEWRKADGDRIGPGDTLYVLESEKAAEEIVSMDAGVLRIPLDGPKPGDKVLVGQVLAYLVAEGEAAPLARLPQWKVETTAPDQPGRMREERASIATAAERRTPAISPRGRRVASELGIDWSGLKGSGRNGRIRERDIRAEAADRTAGRLIPRSNHRRIIAARMVAGVTQAAPVTLTARADATHFVTLRNQFKTNSASPDEITPSYTDLILKLTAVALRQHPLLQAQWRDDGLFVPNRVDIAIAVDTEAGLLIPVVRGVDQLTVGQIAARSHNLIALARAGRLTAERMRNATFTVSNLGPLGVEAFTPIIHLPQCAVLGLGRIAREPTVVDNQIVPRDQMTLSLTFDHRVVDGAPAARFLDMLRACVEQPSPWLT
jgi:pyruvate dehydrogenase E2 component (dihydrolipoamide acetyltransferase)